ncbi:MAG: hypothetical protein GY754_37930 [bacterium]|nr:hypothetical protein [bacterium]
MKKIDTKIILGIMGILFIAFYILAGSITQSPESDDGFFSEQYHRYDFFYKLFRNLDYTVRKYNKKELPGTENIVFFFDYSEEAAEEKNDTKTEKTEKTEKKEAAKKNSSKEELIPDDFDFEKSKPKIEKKPYKETLLKWAESGGTLFILGVDTETDPLSGKPIKEGSYKQIRIDSAISQDVKSLPMLSGKYIALPRNPYQVTKLLSTSNGTLLYRKPYGSGSIFILSDSALFANEHMKNEQAAVLVNNLLKPYFENTIYIVQRNLFSYSVSSPLVILFKSKMLYITLQIMLLCVLFVWWKGTRFGTPVHYRPNARRSLTEHITAVGLLYRKSQSMPIIEKINRSYFIYKVKKQLGLTRKVPLQTLVESIHRRTGMNKALLRKLVNLEDTTSGVQILQKEKKRRTILEKMKLR